MECVHGSDRHLVVSNGGPSGVPDENIFLPAQWGTAESRAAAHTDPTQGFIRIIHRNENKELRMVVKLFHEGLR